MAAVKWIKIDTDIFANRKVRHIRHMPDGDKIVLIWVMLLTLAGQCNANGELRLTEDMPYTLKMLADELDFEVNTMQLAIAAFTQLGMISDKGGCYVISGWGEHQNTGGMDKIREQNRLRQAAYRANQRALPERGEAEESKELEKALTRDTDKKESKNVYQQVVDMYNNTCVSLPAVHTLSEARKKAIKARLSSYTLEDAAKVFINAEKSSFLKGANSRKWIANFDWLLKDANFAKTLDGNYQDQPKAENLMTNSSPRRGANVFLDMLEEA